MFARSHRVDIHIDATDFCVSKLVSFMLHLVFDMRSREHGTLLYAIYVAFTCFHVVRAVIEGTLAGVDWEAYERGDLSPIPLVHYHSADFSNPMIHVTARHQACEDDSHILISPRGKDYPGNRALLLDTQGSLVWHHKERGAVSSMQVQSYKGEDYLTYWVGDDNFWGHGVGYFKMVCVYTCRWMYLT